MKILPAPKNLQQPKNFRLLQQLGGAAATTKYFRTELCVESGVWNGDEDGVFPSSRLVIWGSVVSSPAGSEAEPRPKTDLGVF